MEKIIFENLSWDSNKENSKNQSRICMQNSMARDNQAKFFLPHESVVIAKEKRLVEQILDTIHNQSVQQQALKPNKDMSIVAL